ncbi:hypothetical protein [Streptomyces sp. H27-H5]|uniref:hypothetical protein n=1 Tax=Streptomyces sp. H27-H5 TaxID=2996460 RepID=UPI0022721F9A|nr:hypothetical protein [Streptomyces sp. H27-H5]MCY0961485.1 hypothetical protein [Streptomyces sp. H27-H5]
MTINSAPMEITYGFASSGAAGRTRHQVRAGQPANALCGRPASRPLTDTDAAKLRDCTHCVKARTAADDQAAYEAARDADALTPYVEAGRCTSVMGGEVHEMSHNFDEAGRPEFVFPLCRTGAMTNSGTKYRKVAADAPLTCKNCADNAERRETYRTARAAKVAADTAAVAPRVSQVTDAEWDEETTTVDTLDEDTVIRADDHKPSSRWFVARRNFSLGVIDDEGPWHATRGRYAAWSERGAERPDGIVGFYATLREAARAIADANPTGHVVATEPVSTDDPASRVGITTNIVAVLADMTELHSDGLTPPITRYYVVRQNACIGSIYDLGEAHHPRTRYLAWRPGTRPDGDILVGHFPDIFDATRAVAAAHRKATPRPAANLPAAEPAARIVEGVVVSHDGTARGSLPRHCDNADVRAALLALKGLHLAELTDEGHEAATDYGYMVEPRGQGRVAIYWVRGGDITEADGRPWTVELQIARDRLAEAGWLVEGRSRNCVFAWHPVTGEAPAGAPAPRTAVAAIGADITPGPGSAVTYPPTPAGVARGSLPRHADHPDVRAALGILAGLHLAELTDEGTDAATDYGYAIVPEGGGRVAVYWLRDGNSVTADGQPWTAEHKIAADRYASVDWEAQPTTTCVWVQVPADDYTPDEPTVRPATAPARALTPLQARDAVAESYPTADRFEPLIDEDGETLHYTFQVGRLHGARWGWVTSAGTYGRSLERTRTDARNMIRAQADDDQRTNDRAANRAEREARPVLPRRTRTPERDVAQLSALRDLLTRVRMGAVNGDMNKVREALSGYDDVMEATR